jgi:hypothetical protein
MELLKRGLQVRSAESSDLQPLLEEAKRLDAGLVVIGRLPIWEDNATEWSSKLDHASLSLEMYEVSSGKLVSSAERTAHCVTTPGECAPWLAWAAVCGLFGDEINERDRPGC